MGKLKKTLVNTFTLSTLICYLIGICGLNLMSQNCSSCERQESSIIYQQTEELYSDNECNTKAECIDNQSDDKSCCELSNIFLNNKPNTTLNKYKKTLDSNLYTFELINFINLKEIFYTIRCIKYSLLKPSISINSNQELLCCFIC